MKVDAVASRQDRAGRFTVRFEDGTVLHLYRQTVEDFGIYPGMTLTDVQWENLRTAAGQMSAKMRAVRMVSAASVSRKGLEQKLIQKGENPDQAKQAVQWMTDLQLLDDSKTAQAVVSRCAAKGYGIARAKQALFEKRIPKEYWQAALEDYPDQTDTIVRYLRSTLGDSWDRRELQKAIQALMRRGHSYSEIRRGMQMLSPQEDFPEE